MTRTPLAAAFLAAALLTAGCGTGTDSGTGDADRQRDRPRAAAKLPPSSPTATSDAPSDPASAVRPQQRERRIVARPTRPTKPGNALTVRAYGPDGHLIGAGDLGKRWSIASTTGEHGRVMSDCHRATMRDVGAKGTRLRDFLHQDDGRAVQAVSKFVDGKSAWRVEQVVISWADDCRESLRDRDAAIGAVRHGLWVSVVEIAGVDSPRRQLRAALRAVDATF